MPQWEADNGYRRRACSRSLSSAIGALISTLIYFSVLPAAAQLNLEAELEAAELRYRQYEQAVADPNIQQPSFDHTAPQYNDTEIAREYFEQLQELDPRVFEYEIENLQDDSIRRSVEEHMTERFLEEANSQPDRIASLLDDIANGELDPAFFDMYTHLVRVLFDRSSVDALRRQTNLGTLVDQAITQLSDGRASREDYIRAHPEDTVVAEINQQRARIENRIRVLRPRVSLGEATPEEEREWNLLMQQFNVSFCHIDSADSFYSELDDLRRQDDERRQIYSEVYSGAQAYGGFSEEDRQRRIDYAQVAGALVELQHLESYVDFDSEWLEWIEDIHLTTTGEIIGGDNENYERYQSLVVLMTRATDNIYFYEAMVASAEQYLAQPNLSATQREYGQQILRSSRRSLIWEAEALRNCAELIMGGVALDVLFMGPVGKFASNVAPTVSRAVRTGGSWVWEQAGTFGRWVWRNAPDVTPNEAAERLGSHVMDQLDALRRFFSEESGALGPDDLIPQRTGPQIDDPDQRKILQLPIGEQMANVPAEFIARAEALARQNAEALGLPAELVESAIANGDMLAISEINALSGLGEWAAAQGLSPTAVRRMIDDAGIFADEDLGVLLNRARGAIVSEVVNSNGGIIVLQRINESLVQDQARYLSRVLDDYAQSVNYHNLSSNVIDEFYELRRVIQDNGGSLPPPEQLTAAQVERIAQLADQSRRGVGKLFFFTGYEGGADEMWEIGTRQAAEWIETYGSSPARVGESPLLETMHFPPVSFSDLVGPNGSVILDAVEFDDLVGPNGSLILDSVHFDDLVPDSLVDDIVTDSAEEASRIAELRRQYAGSEYSPMTLRDLLPQFDAESYAQSLAAIGAQHLPPAELVQDPLGRMAEYFRDSTYDRPIIAMDIPRMPSSGSCSASDEPYDWSEIGEMSYHLSVVSQLALAENPLIYAEPNALRVKQQPDAPVPSDPIMNWGNSRINLPAATSLATDNEVIIAIVDSGINWHHPNLSTDQLWKNSDEIPANGIDDDGNGYVDDLIGWNFVGHNNLPLDGDGHGTFVAGIIASQARNESEPQGVNPDARLMIIRALDDSGESNAWALARAITYAADNGADIINLSAGGWQPTMIEQAAIDHAVASGVLVVVAAGNYGQPVEGFSPATMEGVLSVAATDNEDIRAGYSNYGQSISIAAPGTNVVSLRAPGTHLMHNIAETTEDLVRHLVGRDYLVAAGTSFAAPFVSGTASLLLQKDPLLTPEQLERMLLQSARDISEPGTDQFTGYGLLDTAAAMEIDPEFFVDGSISGIAVIEERGQPALQVLGSADADEFRRAWVEIGEGESPDDWDRTDIEIRDAIPENGILGILGVDQVSGASLWTLRLIVEHQDGRQREARFLLRLG